jgi:RHS repeat-associated protein
MNVVTPRRITAHSHRDTSMGRRVKKSVYAYASAAWQLDKEILFVYDGWNMIQESTTDNGQPTTDTFYVWGLDISQSLQGAGGVGGLLTMVDNGTAYHYFYDANGNVGQLVKASDGTIAAQYQYDPFGKLLYSSGPMANDNPFRFSTKYQDDETGLVYFGFRFYSPQLGRWINRDPISEPGGLNLYAFVGNNPIVQIDRLGLVTFKQLNEIASAMGLKPAEYKNRTDTERLIKEIQQIAGVTYRGTPSQYNIGAFTLNKIEAWLSANGKSVKFRDVKTSKEVFTWIAQAWPKKPPIKCPIGIGEFLALIYYESKDGVTKTDFNAVGGPYASEDFGYRGRIDAVGLAQFTPETEPSDAIRYNGEQSIRAAVNLLWAEAQSYGRWDNVYSGKRRLYRALDRWQAWRAHNSSIISKGEAINKLLISEAKGGDPFKITKGELDAILGIN